MHERTHVQSTRTSKAYARLHRCVAGFAGWARQQLEAELERNVWFLVAADNVAGLAMMGRDQGRDVSWLRDAMWSGSMQQVPFAALASLDTLATISALTTLIIACISSTAR